MNFFDFTKKLVKLTSGEKILPGTSLKARFDFPLHGVSKTYGVKDIADDGTIILDNDEVTKPAGH